MNKNIKLKLQKKNGLQRTDKRKKENSHHAGGCRISSRQTDQSELSGSTNFKYLTLIAGTTKKKFFPQSVTHRGENKHGNGFKSEGSIGNLEFKSRICRYNVSCSEVRVQGVPRQIMFPFQGDLVFMKELAIKNFQINSKLQNHLKLV